MGLSAVCRWVDTQLEPPNRRYCLGFWGVHNRTRQTRFVSEFVGDAFAALNHAMKSNSLRSTYGKRSILYKYPSHLRIR